eukprot:1316865-Rhodomonas_salina.3
MSKTTSWGEKNRHHAGTGSVHRGQTDFFGEMLHCEIKCNNAAFRYKVYCRGVFLALISHLRGPRTAARKP